MKNEKLLFPLLTVGLKPEQAILSVNYDVDFFMNLVRGSGETYRICRGGFGSCISDLLNEISGDSQLIFENKVFVKGRDGKLKVLVLIETIKNVPEQYSDDITVEYRLECNFEEKKEIDTISNEGDFSIALQKLIDLLDIEMHVCAFCQFADFKSTGGEDLRHGWYCFREIGKVDFDVPWFMREDQFENAIPNVDALYWCPKFQYRTKKLT